MKLGQCVRSDYHITILPVYAFVQDPVRGAYYGDVPHEIEINLREEHPTKIHVNENTVGYLPSLRQHMHFVLRGESEPLARPTFF